MNPDELLLQLQQDPGRSYGQFLPLSNTEKGDDLQFDHRAGIVGDTLRSILRLLKGTKTGEVYPEDALILTGLGGFGTRPAKSLGMFVGRPGKSVEDKKLFEDFLDMSMQGASREQTFDKTGWWTDPTTGLAVSEIDDFILEQGVQRILADDNAARVALAYDTTVPVGHASYMLPHPELYSRYPDLGKISVAYDASPHMSTVAGYFRPNREYRSGQAPGVIGLRPGADAEDMLNTATHEMQHAVQHIEGWPTGGSVESMQSAIRPISEQFDDLSELLKISGVAADATHKPYVGPELTNLRRWGTENSINPADLPQALRTEYDAYKNLFDKQSSRPLTIIPETDKFQAYRYLWGEAQARQAGRRAQEGYIEYPWDSLDVHEDWLYKYQDELRPVSAKWYLDSLGRAISAGLK